MQKLIERLFYIIEVQKQIIIYLCFLAFGKNYKPPKPDKITDKKYLKLSVDPLPVFEKSAPKKIYDCALLIDENNIKPVRSRVVRLCLLILFALIAVLLMNISTITTVAKVSFCARYASLLFFRLYQAKTICHAARFVVTSLI